MTTDPFLKRVIGLLELEALASDDPAVENFLGSCEPVSWGRVFGGQVLSQALSAVSRTVDPARSIHSLHSYFLRSGRPELPIHYEVRHLLDGGTVSSRSLVASQSDKPIFHMTCSFQSEISGYEHHDKIPDVPRWDELPSEYELEKEALREKSRHWDSMLELRSAIELRLVNYYNPEQPTKSDPDRRVWMRAKGVLGNDRSVHEAVLAYATDLSFCSTALQPHGVS